MEEDFFSYKKRKAISTAGDVEHNLISAPWLLEKWQTKDNATRFITFTTLSGIFLYFFGVNLLQWNYL